MYRQGDVLLIRVKGLPRDAKQEESKERIILAYGEVTGHAHAIDISSTQRAVAWSAAAERFIQMLTPARLTHEEHASIRVPAGIYRIVIQREYSPEAIINVAD